MERVITTELSHHLLTKGIISKQQHSFIVKRSTTTNLLGSINDWTICLENKKNCNYYIRIDFARAFEPRMHQSQNFALQIG